MPRITQQKVFRLIDANFNRAKEALRVCEDVCRFYLEYPASTRQYKQCRHELTAAIEALDLKALIGARSIETDVGRGTTKAELHRQTEADIYYANSQRAKESVRVLEECAKLLDSRAAQKIKMLRYKLYGIEKKVVSKL